MIRKSGRTIDTHTINGSIIPEFARVGVWWMSYAPDAGSRSAYGGGEAIRPLMH